MNTLFETVKAVVRPREAAERYGLPVSQGGMARCPFHDDKTPSMMLYENSKAACGICEPQEGARNG